MKINRSGAMIAVLGGVSLGALATPAAGQTGAPAPANISLRAFPITVAAGDYDLVNQVLDLPPGSGAPNHIHAGPVVVTVVTGEVTLIEAGSERVVKAGESWTENTGYVHAITNKSATTVRLAVTYLTPKGAARTTLVK